jgi:cytoskeletal protein RodZ
MFYEELKRHRESLGITLDQIANKTKINKATLIMFESGDFSKLPETYVRLFIRAYTHELNIDPEETLREYEKYIGKEPEPKEPEKKEPESSFLSPKNEPIPEKGKKRNIAAITTILVILIFLISVLKQVLMEEEKKKPTPLNNTFQKIPEPAEESDTVITAIESDVETAPAAIPETIPELLSLVMTTSDTCWVRVITDERDTTEANYLPHIRREWIADNQFDVRIGRPRKVELFLNDKRLGPLGAPGIPTRLIITKDGIIRSTLLRR